MSNNAIFDSLFNVFSSDASGAITTLLSDENSIRLIDGQRFLELVSDFEPVSLDFENYSECSKNLFALCAALLEKRPESLMTVREALSKVFSKMFESCSDSPEASGLISILAEADAGETFPPSL